MSISCYIQNRNITECSTLVLWTLKIRIVRCLKRRTKRLIFRLSSQHPTNISWGPKSLKNVMTFATNTIGHGVLEILMNYRVSLMLKWLFGVAWSIQSEYCCSTYDFSSMIANESCLGHKKFTQDYFIAALIVQPTPQKWINIHDT